MRLLMRSEQDCKKWVVLPVSTSNNWNKNMEINSKLERRCICLYAVILFAATTMLLVSTILLYKWYDTAHSLLQEYIKQNGLSRVCYYVPDLIFTPDKIDPTLCTHIIVGFGTVRNGTVQPMNSTDLKVYQQVNSLKKKAPLKTLLSIGGTSGPGQFIHTIRNEKTRQSLIAQAIQFLIKNDFDGLDIDWEFPGWNGDPPDDKEVFVTFLKEFYEANAQLTNGKLLLTAAVAAVSPIVGISYNIPQIAKYVDFISIMCYDYHQFQDYFPFTGHNSPLFKRHDDIFVLALLNIQWSASYWETNGMPKNKIIVGLPTYGHTFHLLFANKNSVYSLATGPGTGKGWITFPEVCSVIQAGGVRVFDNESLVPYVYNDHNWISYDDVQSLTIKAKWIVSMGYAGAMTWNLNCDDWNSTCGNEYSFPLHKALRDNL